MIYTVRYAHLQNSFVRIGDIIHFGDKIGTMGNTGSSTGPHLHLDVTIGRNTGRFTLFDMEHERIKPSPKQAAYFIDEDLFKGNFLITTSYADPAYLFEFKKLHTAFDVVPMRRVDTKEIFWNRTCSGEVIDLLFNDPGYGNCVYIAFDA